MSEPSEQTLHVLEVNRSAIGESRLATEQPSDLADGEVRLRIDRFAITANNITYAVFGDMLAYWEFFPTKNDDGATTWGRVPAMGWAEVTESKNAEIIVGSRYYGWYPMATSVTIKATATADGFRDDGDHRQPHAPIYRAYLDTRHDALYDTADDGEDRHALLRGLFLTGFLAEEFFESDHYFGAGQVIVLSASSKTAIGFAQRASERSVNVVGLTSAGNAEFVTSVGYYDTVVTYDELSAGDGGASPFDVGTDAVVIDMAGNPSVLSSVHHILGDRIKYSMTVGNSHHDAPTADADQQPAPLPGAQPEFFFAPTEVERRQGEWGRQEFGQRAAEALTGFVEGSRQWLTVQRRTGADAAQATWGDVHDGNVKPSVGLVVSLH